MHLNNKMKMKLGIVAALGGLWFLGKSKTGGDYSVSNIQSSFEGGIDLINPPAVLDSVMGSFRTVAQFGSKIPIVGENVVAPVVAGAYGVLWGWTY